MTEATGTALEQRSAVVSRVPVPSQLSSLGVRIGRDDESGMAVVMIPPEVRRAVNVINPVSSFVQADSNWTPSISLVQLDKDAHTYNVSGKLGLNKQALETLAVAGGVIETRVRRLRAEELGPGERWGFEATVVIRRSDGVPVPTSRQRAFNEEVELAEIEDEVRKAKVYQQETLKFDTEDKVQAEITKRWRNELRFGPAKTESKAINRAIRAALQVPTSLKPADFAKPFLVIGYSFTPNYDDVEMKRLLVAAGLGAHTSLYGGSAPLGIEAPVAEVLATDEPAPEDSVDAGDGDVVEGSVDVEQDGTQQADSDVSEEAPIASVGDDASESVPGNDDEPGPEAEPEQQSFAVPAAIAEQIGETVVPMGQWQGRTLADIAENGGEGGQRWLLWACRQSADRLPDDLQANVHAYCKARVPAVWEAYSGGASE